LAGAPALHGMDELQPPKQGRFPVHAFHAVVEDLILGINADEVKRAGGVGIGAGAVGRTIAAKWETRLIYSLFAAAARGDVSLVSAALEQKADPCSKHVESGTTALHTAAAAGSSPEVLNLLALAGADIDAVDKSGNTPLQSAMNAGKARSAVELLHLGADASKLPSKRDATYAFLASCPKKPTRDHVRLLKKLWAAPMQTRQQKERQENQMRKAVFVCVTSGWVGGMATILEGGANPSSCDKKSRRTALELADAMLNYEMANLLLAYGAVDRDRPDHKDWALCLAAARGDWLAAVHWAHNATLDWREPPPGDRLTAMHYAAAEGHGDIVRLLVKAGHSVELLDKRGKSAADLAAERGHAALTGYLEKLEKNAIESRARALVMKSGGKPEDYLTPLRRAGEHTLKPMLMPDAGEEVPWQEADMSGFDDRRETNVDTSRLQVTVVSCRALEAGTFNWSLDAYVKVRMDHQEFKTAVIPSSNPMYNSTFEFHDVKDRSVITFTVYDKDMGLWEGDGVDDLLGRLDVPISAHRSKMLDGEPVAIHEKLKHQLADSNGQLVARLTFAPL